MALALAVARLALACLFLAAGLFKLVDREGFRRALPSFGVPSALQAPFALFLPLAELAIGVGLIPAASAWPSAPAALVLLLIVFAGGAVAFARASYVDCRSIGRAASGVMGPAMLARYAVLAAIAGFIAWQAPAHPGGAAAMSGLGLVSREGWLAIGVSILTFVVLAAESWTMTQLIAQTEGVLRRFDSMRARLVGGPTLEAPGLQTAQTFAAGLPTGSRAPAFSLPGLYGETLTLETLRSTGRPVLLLFINPRCEPCDDLLQDIGRWQRELGSEVTLALISRGTSAENLTKTGGYGHWLILLQRDREVAVAYRAAGTPSAVLIDRNGRVGSPLARGPEAIRRLVAFAFPPDPAAQPWSAPEPETDATGPSIRCPQCV